MRKYSLLSLFFILTLSSCKPSIEDKYLGDRKTTEYFIETLDTSESRVLQSSINRLEKEKANLNKMTYLEILNKGKKWEEQQQKIIDEYNNNVEVVKYYIENESKYNLTDENGISQKYEARKEYLVKDKKFEKIIPFLNFKNTISSYQTVVKYKLFLNGKSQGEMEFKGYYLESVHANEYQSHTYNLDEKLDYIPELDSDDDKKMIVKSWTNPYEGELYVQTATQALYECGMIKEN